MLCNQGEKKIFDGPVTLSEAPGLVTGENPEDPDGFRSIMCDCAMNYITCVPEDKFEVVLYCDASAAIVSIPSQTETVARSLML